MPDPAHSIYRDRLALLATDDIVVRAIQHVAAPGNACGPWVRVYSRFLPGAAPYAIVVLGSERTDVPMRTVELFELRPDDRGDAPLVPHATLGWMAVSAFPRDGGLPTLGAAMARIGAATVVRYRPGRRCTVRVERGPDTYFCKIFPDDTGHRLHEEGQQLQAAAARHELGFRVAEPVEWHAGTRTLCQRSIGGVAIYPRLAGPDGVAFMRRLGEAVGTLPRSSVRPQLRSDAEVQCQRSWRYARELGRRVPGLAEPAAALVQSLEAMHRHGPRRAARVIHGAPHMHQWLDLGDRLGLVDFDRLSAGDPELDVATFLGELDFEDGLACPVVRLAESFVAGYEASAGGLDRRLLSAYRAHKRLAKALRSARALRADGDTRATRHFRTAHAALECEGVA